MTQVGYTKPASINARRVESYDPSIGCLAIRFADGWVVVFPTGTILKRFGDDEYEARNYAMFLNLTNDIIRTVHHDSLPPT